MKHYKLINKQTGEEHICDKVTIDGFDYYVSDEKATEGFYGYINFQGGDIKKVGKYFADDWKLVIATNNPNIDIPTVVDEVEIEELAWKEAKSKFAKEEGREPNINNEKDCFVVGVLQEGIIHGYNKSQETHPFSEEDMIDFAEWCDTSEEVAVFWRKNRVSLDMSGSHNEIIKERRKELLQIWKEQQPKIVYYV